MGIEPNTVRREHQERKEGNVAIRSGKSHANPAPLLLGIHCLFIIRLKGSKTRDRPESCITRQSAETIKEKLSRIWALCVRSPYRTIVYPSSHASSRSRKLANYRIDSAVRLPTPNCTGKRASPDKNRNRTLANGHLIKRCALTSRIARGLPTSGQLLTKL